MVFRFPPVVITDMLGTYHHRFYSSAQFQSELSSLIILFRIGTVAESVFESVYRYSTLNLPCIHHCTSNQQHNFYKIAAR